MKDRLFKLLGIESGEESMISMLLMQSVFIGIFFGAFDISAHSLFLSIFDEKMMAKGYVVSGVAGIILTSIYTGLQTRMIFRKFATGNLIFVTLLTLMLWIVLHFSHAKLVVFLVFIMLGPLNILAMLGFWGTVGRLFTLRQGKRLFGLVDSGLIIGIIISCYAIPVLLSLSFSPHNILLISSAAILTASIIQILIGRRYLLVPAIAGEGPGNTKNKSSVIKMFMDDPYVRIMGIFIALSVMTAFFVQYSFMAVTREQYPAEQDMARFLGIFTGSMMIFTLIVKLLVFAYLIRNYGLRTCLALSPVLIAAFTVIAIGIGMAMGFTPVTSGFMLFFMILALSRLFSKSLKDSIESPSFKVIYQTIDEKTRFEVQSGMDGTMNEISALSSGLLLALLGILSFIKLIHFSIALLIIALLWVYVAFRLYSGYRNSIKKALESGGQKHIEKKDHIQNSEYQNGVSANLAFQNDYFRLITDNDTNLGKYSSPRFFSTMLDHAEKKKDINLIPVLKTLYLHAGANNELRQRASGLAESLEHLVVSPEQKDDRILAAQKILADFRKPQTTQILRLLRENSVESKKLGIYMIGKFRLTDMIREVCDCLNVPGLETQAASVLKSFGEEAGAELRKYYLVSSGNLFVSKSILRLLGENCRDENISFLFSRLWSSSRHIKEISLSYLTDSGYKAADDEKDRLHQLISDVIGVMVWNLSAKVCLQRKNDAFLLNVIDKEIVRWNTFLFNILSITYDSKSVSTIRENLENGTVASVNYALEMIDMVIDESIKPKLIQLLDIISDEEKLRSLYQFYPGAIPDYNKLVGDILNRDYNLLGIWTRACTLKNMPAEAIESLTESLIALHFSPETVLQEEAGRLLARSGSDALRSAAERIQARVKHRLEDIINNVTPDEDLLYNKVVFLAQCLKKTEEDYLLVLAGSLKYLKDLNGQSLNIPGGFILWRLSDRAVEPEAKIFYSNTLTDSGKGGEKYSHFYLMPLDSTEEFCWKFPEQAADILNYIEKNGK